MSDNVDRIRAMLARSEIKWAWNTLTVEERGELIRQCHEEGHDYRYVRGTEWRWDCARCNWYTVRDAASLPLEPSVDKPRFEIVQNW